MGSKITITYHGRTGTPKIHTTPTSSRKYIMVRAKGGGTKRLYKGSLYSPQPTRRSRKTRRWGKRTYRRLIL